MLLNGNEGNEGCRLNQEGRGQAAMLWKNTGYAISMRAYWNLGAAQLLEQSIQRREGSLADGGSLVVRTGQFTGRSPKDKFIVRDEITNPHVDWGAVNQPMSEAHFDRLFHKMQLFWQGTKSSSRIVSPAPIPPTRCPSASSASMPGTPCLRASSSSGPIPSRPPNTIPSSPSCSRPTFSPTRPRTGPIPKPASSSTSRNAWCSFAARNMPAK